jgi:transposase-like protein
VRNVSVLVAIGVDAEGFRDVLGVSEGAKEDKESWKAFLRELKHVRYPRPTNVVDKSALYSE